MQSAKSSIRAAHSNASVLQNETYLSRLAPSSGNGFALAISNGGALYWVGRKDSTTPSELQPNLDGEDAALVKLEFGRAVLSKSDVEPVRVVDACAGAGFKFVHSPVFEHWVFILLALFQSIMHIVVYILWEFWPAASLSAIGEIYTNLIGNHQRPI